MKKITILLIIFLTSCSLNKVVQHHGVHNLDEKQIKLKINQSNKNDIFKLIGPPSTKSTFENDVFVYIERKNSGSKIRKLGKKQLIVNNVLVLEINKRGILVGKKLYNKDDLKNIKFDDDVTKIDYTKKSFIYNLMYSLRQKIDDPLGKKRIKN